jgi:ABC-type nitrate/sulfonate/bicarbonate transport system substrate-binding protein
MRARLRPLIAAFIALGLAHAAAQTPAPPPVPNPHPLTTLRIIVFNGGFNLPLWVAERNGYFDRQGLEMRMSFTPNSVYQMTNLLAGNYDIAMTAIDNVVAYDEGQGEAPIGPDPQLMAFLGSDDAFLSLVTQGPDNSFAALRGKTLTVDAMTTGYAFVLRDLLAKQGISDVSFVRAGGVFDRYVDMLKNPEHAGTIQMTPFDLLGQEHGQNVLVRISDAFGPYQGIVAASTRPWAAAHKAEVIGFIRAYKQAVDWLYDPANRKVAEAILVAHVASMNFDLAHKTCDILLDPKGGFFRDVTPSIPGIKTVLALRSKYGEPQRDLTDPMRYVDMSYLQEAFAPAK